MTVVSLQLGHLQFFTPVVPPLKKVEFLSKMWIYDITTLSERLAIRHLFLNTI
jgi:hypothetical protein